MSANQESSSATMPGSLLQARQLLASGSFKAAWESAVTALSQRPFHPDAYLLLATIAAAAGDSETANRCLSNARTLTPNWAALHGAPLRIATGKETIAWPNSESVLNLSPSNRISVCMIVKNEEAFLARCLESVRAIASQIVVVDTGSTDRTVQIARNHGAEIHTFTWCDDFSAARNASLIHARGDWILVLDADEDLLPESLPKVREVTSNPQAIAAYLRLVDVESEGEGGPGLPRLFRNIPGAHYRGRIHEESFSSVIEISKPWGMQFLHSEAIILHHGYTPQVTENRGKIQRNLRLLQQAVAEPAVTPLARANLLMNLGLETVRSGRTEDGIQHYNQALALANQQLCTGAKPAPEFRAALLQQLSTYLIQLRRFPEVTALFASPLAKSLPLTASDHYACGIANLETGTLAEAVAQFQQCIAKRGQPGCASVNRATLSPAPFHCLALCLARLGRKSEAVDVCTQALQQFQDEPALHVFRARLLHETGQSIDAIKALAALVEKQPGSVEAWTLGGEIALSHPQLYDFAADWIAEALRLHHANTKILAQRMEVLLLSNDTTSAAALTVASTADLDLHSLAVVVFCQTLSGRSGQPCANEQAASAAFIDLYRKLIDANAARSVSALNASLDCLAQHLPTAARILREVLGQNQNRR